MGRLCDLGPILSTRWGRRSGRSKGVPSFPARFSQPCNSPFPPSDPAVRRPPFALQSFALVSIVSPNGRRKAGCLLERETPPSSSRASRPAQRHHGRPDFGADLDSAGVADATGNTGWLYKLPSSPPPIFGAVAPAQPADEISIRPPVVPEAPGLPTCRPIVVESRWFLAHSCLRTASARVAI